MKLTSRINHHTTPVQLPSLKRAAGEELRNALYQQKAEKGAEPSPPPAVTIPMDRVDPKHRLFDDELGAPGEPEASEQATPAAAEAIKELAKPDFAAATASARPPAPPVIMGPPATLPMVPPAPPTRPKPPLPPLKKPDAAT